MMMRSHARTSARFRRACVVGGGVLGTLLAGHALPAQSAVSPPTKIPLVPGLMLVKAARTRDGDYEAMSVISAISARGVELNVSGEVPSPGQKPVSVNVTRIVRVADLKDSRTYKYYFNTMDEPVVAGTTALGPSTAVIAELRAHGETKMTLDGRSGGLVGLVDDLLGSFGKTGGASKALGAGALATGTLKLVTTKPVFFPVLVNSVKTMLPVLHVHGRIGDADNAEDADLFFLDDPANPLTLRFAIASDTFEVTNIEFPVADASRTMERELRDARRSVLYGIYFDFNSATIRPQSQPVLHEIVDVMQREPAWTLKVEGHTDNIGGTAKNADLSARRAAAVKTALVGMGIADKRLNTGGYGASVPRETNATLAGRARNRRVELSRE